jgi:hypothetical protein
MSILPRPVSPRSATHDLWDYLRSTRAHKWPLMGVSAALTYLIIWAFITDANMNTMPRQNQIIYIQNWAANRTDADRILEQKKDLASYEAALVIQQEKMRKVADTFGVEWRAEAEANSAKRAIAIKQINEQLDARLAKAEAAGGDLPARKAPPAKAATK